MRSPCRDCQQKVRTEKRCFKKCEPLKVYREWLDRQDTILQAVDTGTDYRLLPM